MKKILLAITGSIAAVRSYELIRVFQSRGVEVQCVVTNAGEKFISRLALESLSGYPVVGPHIFTFPEIIDPRKKIVQDLYAHIELSKTADAIIVAPASAESISKITHGNANDFLSALILASQKPLILAPAMNSKMWDSVAVQENIALLENRGVHIIPPQVHGVLACGEKGIGKMEEIESIVSRVFRAVSSSPLQGKNILINTGGTKEYIDPVRFVGNESSGLTGKIFATLCVEMGAKNVQLIQGNSRHKVSDKLVNVTRVQSTEEMKNAMEIHFTESDIIIFSGAVADFIPDVVSKSKIKKSDTMPLLQLKKNIDIAEYFSRKKQPHQRFIGFALETEEDEAKLKNTLHQKSLQKKFDILLGNTPNSFDASSASFLIYSSKNDTFEEFSGEKKSIFHNILLQCL